MKKIIFATLLFLSINIVNAKEINLYLFYSETCLHCHDEKIWLEETYGDTINVVQYEAVKDKDNIALMQSVADSLKINNPLTPFTVIGTTGIVGFSDTQKNQIINAIEKYQNEEHVDIVYNIKNNIVEDFVINPPEGAVVIPFLGTIDAKNVSLPLISILIGFIDGFNPCAMWVLLFLIGMLFKMKSRKKMWIIGVTFLVTSALFYWLAMISVLQISILFSASNIFRILIGLVALVGAFVNLNSYYNERKKDNGCSVVDDKKRKSIMVKMKNIISNIDGDNKLNKKFILALLGIIGLAVSVNMVELACTSGLPVVFTSILAANDLSFIQYISYTLLYILFYLIDDLIVFFIAMTSLKLSAISTKYNKLSHLIGGIIMVIIGLLMIFKPEWIMFNFV